ncbi:MAG: DUF2325 domain-containing protein [Desulfovibrio sp.]|nr:DUF2325 domain-containing protein [Desulfovibrio sp.]
MCVALVGGLDRLKREYESAAKSCGVTLKVFTGKESCLVNKIGSPDLAILLTAMISHNAKDDVVQHSRGLGIPVVFLHSNGISGLRQRLADIVRTGKGKTAGERKFPLPAHP